MIITHEIDDIEYEFYVDIVKPRKGDSVLSWHGPTPDEEGRIEIVKIWKDDVEVTESMVEDVDMERLEEAVNDALRDGRY